MLHGTPNIHVVTNLCETLYTFYFVRLFEDVFHPVLYFVFILNCAPERDPSLFLTFIITCADTQS